MLEYSFMQYAFISGFIIAFVCGLISVFVILRQNAFATHALGHTSLTGAAGAVLFGLSGITGQLTINILAAIIIAILGDKIKKNDLVIGVVLTFFLGLGAYFLFLYQNNYAGGVMSILFGNILAVSVSQIYTLLYLAFFVILLMLIILRPLIISSIDPTIAQSKKISCILINILFFILVAITVSMGCQIVGALLIFVLMVVPGAIAIKWCKYLKYIILLSITISVLSVWSSLILAYYFDLPVSFCITMFLCICYLSKTFLKIIKKIS